jgi:hypothetical protein
VPAAPSMNTFETILPVMPCCCDQSSLTCFNTGN